MIGDTAISGTGKRNGHGFGITRGQEPADRRTPKRVRRSRKIHTAAAILSSRFMPIRSDANRRFHAGFRPGHSIAKQNDTPIFVGPK